MTRLVNDLLTSSLQHTQGWSIAATQMRLLFSYAAEISRCLRHEGREDDAFRTSDGSGGLRDM
jgi:hypothetical protein